MNVGGERVGGARGVDVARADEHQVLVQDVHGLLAAVVDARDRALPGLVEVELLLLALPVAKLLLLARALLLVAHLLAELALGLALVAALLEVLHLLDHREPALLLLGLELGRADLGRGLAVHRGLDGVVLALLAPDELAKQVAVAERVVLVGVPKDLAQLLVVLVPPGHLALAVAHRGREPEPVLGRGADRRVVVVTVMPP